MRVSVDKQQERKGSPFGLGLINNKKERSVDELKQNKTKTTTTTTKSEKKERRGVINWGMVDEQQK